MTRSFTAVVATTFALSAALLIASPGCSTAPKTEAKQKTLVDDADTVVNRFKREDPGMTDLLNRSYGYVVFPSVGKGGVGIGGAYGKGAVYEQGRMVGFADLTQASIGFQLGGQTFAELIVFENKAALEKFKNNQFSFEANASAVAVKSGAAAAAKYENGVAVFTEPNAGLMFEAAVGGQKFTYTPRDNAPGSTTQPASTMP